MTEPENSGSVLSRTADVLIMEDNPSDMMLVLHALAEHHQQAKVFVVRDGEAALDYLFCRGQFKERSKLEQPKLVLLDLKVPKMNGFQVLTEVRKNPLTKLIPVVVLTSSNQTQDVVAAYEVGANSYVQKPVDFDALSEVIRELGSYWLGINLAAPPSGRSLREYKEA